MGSRLSSEKQKERERIFDYKRGEVYPKVKRHVIAVHGGCVGAGCLARAKRAMPGMGRILWSWNCFGMAFASLVNTSLTCRQLF